jgi:diaminopimelate epimerase
MNLPFIKANACGNDFLLIDGSLVSKSEMKAITQRVCDRHRGVGADGVEWLFPSDEADVYAHLINSDGSDAEVSGNGTRCVAASEIWRRMQESSTAVPTEIRVLTDAGVKTCTLVSHSGAEFQFRSDMGEPKIEGEISIPLAGGECRGVKLSTGNPQFILFADEFPANWLARGAEIEAHREFPQRTNVEFVKVTGANEIEIRIFERGAGETQSSGTGSCASAVASIHTGRVKSPVRVVSPGGPQLVEWTGGNIFLTGPAQILCSGEFFL